MRDSAGLRSIPGAGKLYGLRLLLRGQEERVNMYGRLKFMHDTYGNVAAMDVLIRKFVHLFGPDANRLVLMDRERIFSAREPWTFIMGKIFPNGLLLRDGEDHKHHRRIMHTAFIRKALRQYAERMNPMIEESLSGWSKEPTPLSAFRAYKELTLDMAASIFVGVDLGPKARRMNKVFEDLVAASMSRIRLRLPGLEFYRGLKGREFMIGYFSELIGKKRSGDGPDMFSRLCHAETEEGEGLADQDIIDHMIFLMMAAHDTTTSTLSSMTYELAKHPEWQSRVRQESLDLDQEHLTFDDLEKLESLTWVMKETLRRYPPLPVIPRVAQRDFEFEGHTIPPNTMIVVAPIYTHHMDEFWDDPWRFDPERFSPRRAEHERHSHSYIPFGGGPHMCLGSRFAEMQVKAIMHQLVRRYRWSVPEGYEMPVQQAPISKPMDGLPIHLTSLR